MLISLSWAFTFQLLVLDTLPFPLARLVYPPFCGRVEESQCRNVMPEASPAHIYQQLEHKKDVFP